MVDARQRVIPLPAAEIPVQCAARRQVLGDRPPLAAGAEDVQQPVNQRPLVHAALVTAALGGWIGGASTTHSASVTSLG